MMVFIIKTLAPIPFLFHNGSYGGALKCTLRGGIKWWIIVYGNDGFIIKILAPIPFSFHNGLYGGALKCTLRGVSMIYYIT